MQKDVFDLTFELRHLRMMILVSRSMFYRLRNPMVLFVLICDLDLSRSLPLQNHMLAHTSFKKYLEQFERVIYVNALCCPPLL